MPNGDIETSKYRVECKEYDRFSGQDSWYMYYDTVEEAQKELKKFKDSEELNSRKFGTLNAPDTYYTYGEIQLNPNYVHTKESVESKDDKGITKFYSTNRSYKVIEKLEDNKYRVLINDFEIGYVVKHNDEYTLNTQTSSIEVFDSPVPKIKIGDIVMSDSDFEDPKLYIYNHIDPNGLHYGSELAAHISGNLECVIINNPVRLSAKQLSLLKNVIGATETPEEKTLENAYDMY